MNPTDKEPAAPPLLGPILAKLERLSPLSEADRSAFFALPHKVRRLPTGAHLIRDGDRPEHITGLLSGFAFRHKVTGEGARQIVSLHMRGDFVDLQNGFLDCADHNVQTLTEADTVTIPRRAIRDLAFERPAIGKALWIDTLIDSSIFREWVVNVGRRDSLTRVAHLLCEIFVRLQAAGLAERNNYRMPLTQEQLADATGLTSVHINRVLKSLGESGLIRREGRTVTIEDWERMIHAGDFNARYLHAAVPD